MRVFVMIAILFNVFIITLVGFLSLLYLAHFIDLNASLAFVQFLYEDPQACLTAGLVVAATMLISLVFARIIYGRQEHERNISINNPLGRVTISVAALEDLVRRMAGTSSRVKEIRPDITSTAKGLDIDVKLVLRSEGNIPDLTADLQSRIQDKVHDVIGSEERVNIRVHVIKIACDTTESKGKKRCVSDYEEDQEGDAAVPFPGYKA